MNKEQPKDHNMWLVGLGNIRILADFVQQIFPYTGLVCIWGL